MTRPRPEAGRGPRPPHVATLRFVGPRGASPPRRVPFGATLRQDDASGVLVAVPEDVAEDARALAEALPSPDDLAPGALVLVLAEPVPRSALTGRLLSALGRAKAAPRVVRCTALLARGYVDVGAGVDPSSGADLAWGRAPS